MSAWISVNDLLPGDGSPVFVSGFKFNNPEAGRFVCEAYYKSGAFLWPLDDEASEGPHPPTHWMHMPQPPIDPSKEAAS